MAAPPEKTENDLLASLPGDAWERLAPHLRRVELPLGTVLHESGAHMGHAYFPTTAIVSLLYLLEDGDCAEVALVGREGLVGVALFMGGDTATSQAVVQSAGCAYSLPVAVLHAEFERSGPFMHLLLRYAQALITQISQTAVCNRHHCLEQQLCRWLLLSLDRLHGNELAMTQGRIASLLGVRREGVTEAALRLQKRGMICYSRGHITVLDRPALEQHVCECYAVIKRECDRLLPPCTAT